jgi:hypothetical protein
MTRVDELWNTIAATTDRTNVFRRVDETHPLSLYAGIDHDGRRVLMLVTAQAPPQLPPPGIVHVVCNQRENGEFAMILQLGRPEFDEVFGRLCQDLVDATRTAVPALGAEAVLRRLGRWRKLLEVGQRTTLSDTALRGLVGELWFLQHVAFRRLSLDAAVQGWVGPLDAPQDFIVGEDVFEIKTCAPPASHVTIASLQQLDAGEAPLHLVVVWLAGATAGAKDAFNPAQLVQALRTALETSASATTEFALRLAEAGYTDAEEYERTWFHVTNVRYYRVRDDFPRLTRVVVPQGLDEVTYTLALNACAPFEQHIE